MFILIHPILGNNAHGFGTYFDNFIHTITGHRSICDKYKQDKPYFVCYTYLTHKFMQHRDVKDKKFPCNLVTQGIICIGLADMECPLVVMIKSHIRLSSFREIHLPKSR